MQRPPCFSLSSSERTVVVKLYPVPQNAPHVRAGMNVLSFPEGQRPKATDVSPWYGVYLGLWLAQKKDHGQNTQKDRSREDLPGSRVRPGCIHQIAEEGSAEDRSY